MPNLSVIIPARKEEYLAWTVETIHNAIRGDTEILVVIDGEEAGRIVPDLPGVHVIRNEKPLGQRASVNLAARRSNAKFILKTDGHSMLADGFDLALMRDCEYRDIVLPTMYNLHAHDLVCKKCGFRGYNRGAHRPCPQCGVTDYEVQIVFQPNWKRKTDWMWFRSPTCKDRPLRVQYWGMKSVVCEACGGGHDAQPDQGCCDYCGKSLGFHKTREFPEENRIFKAWAKQQGMIADVMTGQGACFFIHRDRFLELGGLDEAHGSWGQVGVEVACKAWLSGGRHVVNRKTWFAHLFRCGDGQSFPYQMHGSDQEKARQYSIDLWSNDRWPLQVRPLEWIVEKFWPVPTWAKPDSKAIVAFVTARAGVTTNTDMPQENDTNLNTADTLRFAQIEQLAAKRAAELTGPGGTNTLRPSPCPPDYPEGPAAEPTDGPPEWTPSDKQGIADRTVLYYTDGNLPQDFAAKVYEQLAAAATDYPLVLQKQPADWPRTHESIYRNILAGLEKVTTPYVALAEHDVLYPEGYFRHRQRNDFDYNVNRWCLHADRGIYSRRRQSALSQLFARTEVLRANLWARLEQWPTDAAVFVANFEPGTNDAALGLPPATIHRFKAKLPTVDITGHGFNLSGAKAPREKTCTEIPYWGTFAAVVATFKIPSAVPVYRCSACGTTFRAWDDKVIGCYHESDSPEEYNEYGCPACGAAEETWMAVTDPDEWRLMLATQHIRSATTQTAATAQAIPAVSGKPKVSILIPARNEPYLEATLRDLLQNLRLPFEIVVGLDGLDQARPAMDDPRVRFIQLERLGMRPMINRLAREARGEYLIRMDAHCIIAEGMDQALVGICEQHGHVGVVAMRYELDAARWQRRDATDIPYRRLSHASEDGQGLRSLPWPEYAEIHKDEIIGETMSCSGSSWTCRRETFLGWSGFDEEHGVFGQEGCEIACMFWLSGGRFLVHKGTWYAHHNRGKATYALGAHCKEQSIKRSHELWVGNQWKFARYGFEWLIEKFSPPGWPKPKPLSPEVARAIKPHKQRALVKANKRLLVSDLWAARDVIADPGKKYRLQIFWKGYEEFVRRVLAGQPEMDGQYRHYLLSHVSRQPGHQPTRSEVHKVEKSLRGSIGLIQSVQQEGLKAPLEFYQEDGHLILWKGYRRLVIARAVGIPRVVGRCYADRQAAGALSPQANLTRLLSPPAEDLHKLAADQFRRWGNGATDKYFTHQYTRYYDTLLQPLRKRGKKVLELGLLNGASLALWREYFPRADIFGVDIEPERWKKFAGKLDRCTVLVGSETDQAFMAGVAKRGPFDLIVDDASHDPLLQRQAFNALWPAVRQYGFYVIEDTFRGYDGGESQKPPGLPLGFEQRIYAQRDVLAIHHYYNISFVQKA